MRWCRRRLLGALLLSGLTGCGAPTAADAAPFSFIVFGDTQDAGESGRASVRALVATINQRAPAFTVHIGDIKGGDDSCADAALDAAGSLFTLVEGPLIFTPGDNDWTDCWRPMAGGHDPRERLEFVRRAFFRVGESLGRQPLPLVQQQPPTIENARWAWGPVLFTTLHVVGSNNNLRQDEAAAAEHFSRDAANLAWLSETFRLAREQQSAGVVLFIHANPTFDAPWWNPTGFDRFRDALGRETRAFAGAVLLVHGDTHTFRIDQPLRAGRDRVGTFTRLEVFGTPDVGAVEVRVDPSSAGLYAFQPVSAR